LNNHIHLHKTLNPELGLLLPNIVGKTDSVPADQMEFCCYHGIIQAVEHIPVEGYKTTMGISSIIAFL
jgi:hypothetical protein